MQNGSDAAMKWEFHRDSRSVISGDANKLVLSR
jgi:hypothetical protein